MAAEGRRFNIVLEGGSVISAGAVIIATGTARKKLGSPGRRSCSAGA